MAGWDPLQALLAKISNGIKASGGAYSELLIACRAPHGGCTGVPSSILPSHSAAACLPVLWVPCQEQMERRPAGTQEAHIWLGRMEWGM